MIGIVNILKFCKEFRIENKIEKIQRGGCALERKNKISKCQYGRGARPTNSIFKKK